MVTHLGKWATSGLTRDPPARGGCNTLNSKFSIKKQQKMPERFTRGGWVTRVLALK